MDWPKGYLKIRCISFGFLACLLPCDSLPCALAVSFSTFSSRDWSQQSGADIVTQKQEHDKAVIHLFRCFAGPLKVKCVDYEKSIFSKQFPFEISVMQRKDEVKRHICKFCSQHSQLSSWLRLHTAACITASTIHNLLQADWRAWLLNILLLKTMRVITEQSGFIWRTQWTRINLAGFWPFSSQTRFALWDSGFDLNERNIFLTILTPFALPICFRFLHIV